MRTQSNIVVNKSATVEAHDVFMERGKGNEPKFLRHVFAHTPIKVQYVNVVKKYEGNNMTILEYIFDDVPEKAVARGKRECAPRMEKKAVYPAQFATKKESEETAAAKKAYRAAEGTVKVRKYDDAVEKQHWKEDHYAKADGMGEDEVFADKLIPGPERLFVKEENRQEAEAKITKMFGFEGNVDKQWARVEVAEAAREAVEATFDWEPIILLGERPTAKWSPMREALDKGWPNCPLAIHAGERAASRRAPIHKKRSTLKLTKKEVLPTEVARAVLAADGKRLKTLLENAFNVEGEERKDAVSAIAKRRADYTFKVTRVLHGCALLEVMTDDEAENNLLRATTMIDTAAAMAARRAGANKWNPTLRSGYTIRYDQRGKEYSMGISTMVELREALHMAPHYAGILKREVVEVVDHKELKAIIKQYEQSWLGAERPLTKPNLVRRAEQALRNAVGAAAWSDSSKDFWKAIVTSADKRLEDARTDDLRGSIQDHYQGIDKVRLGNPTDDGIGDQVYNGSNADEVPSVAAGKRYRVGNQVIEADVSSLNAKARSYKQVMEAWQSRAEDAEELFEAIEVGLRSIYPYDEGDALVYKYTRHADGSFETVTDLEQALVVEMATAQEAAAEAHSDKSWARMEREYDRAMAKIAQGMTAFGE